MDPTRNRETSVRVISTNSKEDDRIVDLPGVDTPPIFKQYSGYLSGADDNIQLHYWLVESSFDPEAAPLLLWLNGGPGCSSLEGLVSENGPYKLVKGPKLVENQFSWNKVCMYVYLIIVFLSTVNIITTDYLTIGF
ncbi:unnamed protein product [Trichobilharzia regenti]|nr:unnamed protein product [Trichobilharzia regenti]